jgi:AbrB family looped-hinge helix DNA binding protein
VNKRQTDWADVDSTSVTSKGQVTIPKQVRQRLGIRQGSRIEFAVIGDHARMRVQRPLAPVPDSGFGMLKSRRAPVPADFDPATVLKR